MIAAPCSMGWDEMHGDERVRLCGGCNKSVYNTSAMTADEVSTLLSKEGPLPCLRLYRRADGTLITKDCPKGLKRVRAGWQNLKRLVAAAWLALFGMQATSPQVVSAQETSAQTKVRTKYLQILRRTKVLSLHPMRSSSNMNHRTNYPT
ncbi:MAG: hypothetical protein IPP57_20420 [Candidatus Obscuribacter sp.]|nr:hypothetical protein [Candidatus Obscuribacter sp.]